MLFGHAVSPITEKLCNKRKRNKRVSGVGGLLFTPHVYAIKMSTMTNGNMNLTTDGEPNRQEWIQGVKIHDHCWMDTNFVLKTFRVLSCFTELHFIGYSVFKPLWHANKNVITQT